MQRDPVDAADVYDELMEHASDAASLAGYRFLATHTRDVVLLLDAHGVILWAAPSLLHVAGREPQSVVGHHCGDFLHPDDRAKQREVFGRRAETGAPLRVELRVRHVDGSYRETESIGVPVFAQDGTLERMLITARDITDRKSIERQLRASEQRFREILDQIPANVWTTGMDLVVTSSVGGGMEVLGFRPGEFVGRSLEDVFRAHPRGEEVVRLHKQVLAGESLAYETRWNERDLFVRINPVRDAGGTITGLIGMTFDLSEQKRAERRYRTLFERNLAGVFRATVSGRMLECNDSFARMFGYDSARQLLSVPTPSLYYTPADRDIVLETIRARGEIVNHEVKLRKRSGEPVWTLLNETITCGDGDEEPVLEGTIIDISARKEAEDRIEYQAFHDALTDLPNRFLLNDRLALALGRAERHKRAVAVLFLDLDHFKLINDTMAHTAGDELLRLIAVRLSSCVRAEDTVARLGGDEFVFILPEIDPATAAASAARVVEKVLDEVRMPLVVHGRELFVTASVGIAISPQDGGDGDTLIKNADAAMYRAKDAGRNNYQFHTPQAQRRAEVRLTLETALRRAIERDELFLMYQPIVELATGRVASVEALLRWSRPGVGIVEPKDFIPLAEEIGAIVPIGEWVLRTAGLQLREWQRRGRPDVRLSVNLSPRQFQHERLSTMIENVLTDTGLDPRCLDLEITESLAIRDTDMTIARMEHFRSRGIGASLDDFGTGYSSLAHLRFLPLDAVKIDRSFVVDMRDEGREKAIVQAIVTMGHSLKLRVVAEGVETEEQRRILTAMGCDELQGFVFSRPLCVADAEKLLLG